MIACSWRQGTCISILELSDCSFCAFVFGMRACYGTILCLPRGQICFDQPKIHKWFGMSYLDLEPLKRINRVMELVTDVECSITKIEIQTTQVKSYK